MTVVTPGSQVPRKPLRPMVSASAATPPTVFAFPAELALSACEAAGTLPRAASFTSAPPSESGATSAPPSESSAMSAPPSLPSFTSLPVSVS